MRRTSLRSRKLEEEEDEEQEQEAKEEHEDQEAEPERVKENALKFGIIKDKQISSIGFQIEKTEE